MKKKVAVAMSGGVDSSVTAALLKERGFDVIGVTMVLYGEHGRKEDRRIQRSIKDAKAVAESLGIRHVRADFRRSFERTIIRNFCREYAAGRTPNPCITCNNSLRINARIVRLIFSLSST